MDLDSDQTLQGHRAPGEAAAEQMHFYHPRLDSHHISSSHNCELVHAVFNHKLG